jgi:hypothetical protein
MARALRNMTVVVFALFTSAAAHATPAPYDKVDAVFGKKPQTLPGNVYKYTWPRSDLQVTVNGTPIAAGLALGSWAAFTPIKDKTWVMGDLVLLQSEVGPVIEKLQASNFEITGVHNHLMNESPRIVYVHYMGEGGELRTVGCIAEERSRTDSHSAETHPTADCRESTPWMGVRCRILARTQG